MPVLFVHNSIATAGRPRPATKAAGSSRRAMSARGVWRAGARADACGKSLWQALRGLRMRCPAGRRKCRRELLWLHNTGHGLLSDRRAARARPHWWGSEGVGSRIPRPPLGSVGVRGRPRRDEHPVWKRAHDGAAASGGALRTEAPLPAPGPQRGARVCGRGRGHGRAHREGRGRRGAAEAREHAAHAFDMQRQDALAQYPTGRRATVEARAAYGRSAFASQRVVSPRLASLGARFVLPTSTRQRCSASAPQRRTGRQPIARLRARMAAIFGSAWRSLGGLAL